MRPSDSRRYAALLAQHDQEVARRTALSAEAVALDLLLDALICGADKTACLQMIQEQPRAAAQLLHLACQQWHCLASMRGLEGRMGWRDNA